MATTVTVDVPHSLGVEEVKKKLVGFSDDIKKKYGMTLHWRGDEADLKGTGASGTVKVTPNVVTVTVKLGMMVSALVKPDQLKESISRKLGAALNGPSVS